MRIVKKPQNTGAQFSKEITARTLQLLLKTQPLILTSGVLGLLRQTERLTVLRIEQFGASLLRSEATTSTY